MPNNKITNGNIKIIGNNQNLITVLAEYFSQNNLQLVSQENRQELVNYLLIVIQSDKVKNEINISLFEKEFNRLQKQAKVAVIVQVSQLNPQKNVLQQTDRLIQVIFDKNINCRKIIAWDLISPTSGKPISSLDQLTQDALTTHQVNVSRNGNVKLFPLVLDDFNDGLSRSLFLNGTDKQKYCFGGTATTDIDYFLDLKNVCDSKNIDLELNQGLDPGTPLSDPEDEIDSTSAKLNWFPRQDSHTLTLRLINLVDQKVPLRKKIKIFSKLNLSQSISDFRIKSILKILGAFFTTSFVVLGFLLFSYFFIFRLSLKYASEARWEFQQGNIEKSILNTQSSSRKLNLANNLYPLISSAGKKIAPKLSKSLSDLSLSLSHSLQLLEKLQQSYLTAESYYQDSLSNVDLNPRETSLALIGYLESLQTEINQILLTSQNSNEKKKIKIFKNQDSFTFATTELNQLKKQISQAIPALKILPLVFPQNKNSYYLVLIQDNNELRPSGGFINTYALVTFNGNKLIDTFIDSSLHLDAQLEGKVSAPTTLSALSGLDSWNFSDSNIFASFPETASQSAWFYKKITGQSVDGVVAINLSFFEDLLKDSAPITLETGQQITAENIRLILTNPSQINDSDTLTKITKQVFEQIKSKTIPPANVIRAFVNGLSSSEINLWLADTKAQEITSSSRFSSTIRQTPCLSQFAATACLSETYYYNESNFSINKSNFYQKRQTEHTIDINQSGQLNHRFIIDYSYPNPCPTIGNMEYRGLVKFYVPQGSGLQEIKIDDQIIDPQKINLQNKYGLTEIEFPFNYILNQKHRLEINTVSPQKIYLDTPYTSYSVSYLKQPGASYTNQSLIINTPDNFIPKLLSSSASVSRQSIKFIVDENSTDTCAIAFSLLSR